MQLENIFSSEFPQTEDEEQHLAVLVLFTLCSVCVRERELCVN